jgi:enolase
MSAAIRRVLGRQIFDSRGRPTVEVDVELEDGSLGRAAVPSGASTGRHEALELRDGDVRTFAGLGVLRAVANVNDVVQPVLTGCDAHRQDAVDRLLLELDGTLGLTRLGANAVLGVSLAVCRAAAVHDRRPLYAHIADLSGTVQPQLPLPMANILSGGAHAEAGRGMDIQDCLAVAVGAADLNEALAMTSAVRLSARHLLEEHGQSVLLADEGGFAPDVGSVEAALELMVESIEHAGLHAGHDVAIALDVAASQLSRQPGEYHFAHEQRTFTATEMVERVARWVSAFPVVSVEDPLGEDDWSGWTELTARVGATCQVVGDDLFCTNIDRLQKGLTERAANAVLIKLNQIGTLSATLGAMRLAQAHGYRTIVSARSGETEDAFMSDLAVGTAAGQIKIGSFSTSERLAKYNQLVRIQELLGAHAFANYSSLLDLARR